MSASNIHFFFEGTRITLPERQRLKAFLSKLLYKYGKEIVHLNYVFCSDPALRKINKEHLGHDYFTDIVTFDLSENPGKLQAEIYISVDRVRDNARTYHTTLRNELHRVIFHGALHLCGFRDKTKQERVKMQAMENQCINHYST